MACILANGYSLDCKDSLGGIQIFYIGNFSAGTNFTYNSTGTITGGTSTPTFYTFNQRNEVGEFSQEGSHSVENGTNFWTQNANLTLYKYQASIRDLLYVLAQQRLQIIVLDQNGKYFLLGEQNGSDMTASAANVGKAYGDLNGATFTLSAKEPSPAREMTSVYFLTLTVVA